LGRRFREEGRRRGGSEGWGGRHGFAEAILQLSCGAIARRCVFRAQGAFLRGDGSCFFGREGAAKRDIESVAPSVRRCTKNTDMRFAHAVADAYLQAIQKTEMEERPPCRAQDIKMIIIDKKEEHKTFDAADLEPPRFQSLLELADSHAIHVLFLLP